MPQHLAIRGSLGTMIYGTARLETMENGAVELNNQTVSDIVSINVVKAKGGGGEEGTSINFG